MVKKEEIERFPGQKNGSGIGKIGVKKVKRMVWGHGAKGGLGVKRERVGLQIYTYSFGV